MKVNISQASNWLYFYRKRALFNTMAFVGYTTMCWRGRNWTNETARMGIAGSMAFGTVEALFHFVDTVNIKSKASKGEVPSTMSMVKNIYKKEGVVGFGRGIGAAIYGNYTAGLIYFVLYKWLKNNMPELGGFKALIAGFIAETVTILYKFPFDLVKCRMQSVNYIFKYSDWRHGIRKEYRANGVVGLYSGVTPYLLTNTTFIALQFSIYEKILLQCKGSMPVE